VVCGALSWKFVETPFRQNRSWATRKFMFLSAAIGTASWILFGLVVHVLRGVPERLGPEALRFAAAASDYRPGMDDCVPWRGSPDAENLCLVGERAAGAPSFVLWGDSHAAIFVHGVEDAAKRNGRLGLFSTLPSCPPMLGVAKDDSEMDASDDALCPKRNEQIWRLLQTVPSIESVLMIGRWTYYTAGQGVGDELDHTLDLSYVAHDSGQSNIDIFRAGLKDTIERLVAIHKRVYVLQQVPEIEEYRAIRMAIATTVGTDPSVILSRTRTARTRVEQRQAGFERSRPDWEHLDDVHVMLTRDYFCDSEYCVAVKSGRPVMADNNHVTATTSKDLSRLFDAAFARGRQ